MLQILKTLLLLDLTLLHLPVNVLFGSIGEPSPFKSIILLHWIITSRIAPIVLQSGKRRYVVKIFMLVFWNSTVSARLGPIVSRANSSPLLLILLLDKVEIVFVGALFTHLML